MFRRTLAMATVLSVISALSLSAREKPWYAGPTENGFLLPNGWTLSPAGKQVPLGDLPLNIIPLADGRHALVATDGFN
jgi:hypothetical protein